MKMIFNLTATKRGNWEIVNEKSHVDFSRDSLLVEIGDSDMNSVCTSLCHSDTKNTNPISLFRQMEKDLLAIHDFDRFMKIEGKK